MLGIKAENRLIVALDFPDINQAIKLVEEIGDKVSFYKIGLELLMSGEYFNLIKWLEKRHKKVFADLKLFDISRTVANSIKNLSYYQNISFLTIHSASREIMLRAFENKAYMKILAVTILTNLDKNDLSEMGFPKEISITDLVLKRSILAKECGIDGVVSSVLETKEIRKQNGENFLIINPGVRLNKVLGDDQKRIGDVKTAIINGADYLVVGRPIANSAKPRHSAELFIEEINSALKMNQN